MRAATIPRLVKQISKGQGRRIGLPELRQLEIQGFVKLSSTFEPSLTEEGKKLVAFDNMDKYPDSYYGSACQHVGQK